MSKKVLVLSSSPRKGGNSDLLCDRFIDGAREAGHETEKIYFKDKTIDYCTGCGALNHRLKPVATGSASSCGPFFGNFRDAPH